MKTRHWICNCEEGFIFSFSVPQCYDCGKSYKQQVITPNYNADNISKSKIERNLVWLKMYRDGCNVASISKMYSVKSSLVCNSIRNTMAFLEKNSNVYIENMV